MVETLVDGVGGRVVTLVVVLEQKQVPGHLC